RVPIRRGHGRSPRRHRDASPRWAIACEIECRGDASAIQCFGQGAVPVPCATLFEEARVSYGRHDGRSGGTAAYHAIMAWSASVVVHIAVATAGAVLAASATAAGPTTFLEHVARQPAPTTITVELPSLSALAAAGWLGESPVETQPELGG